MSYYLIGTNSDHIDFDNKTYMILKDGLSGFAGYPVEYNTTSPPDYIGEVVNHANITPREISLHVVVFGNGRKELEKNRLRLINALNPLAGHAQFCWVAEDGEEYFLDVSPSDGTPDFSNGTRHDAQFWECTLNLIAHDPCWKLNYEELINIIGERNRFILPFDPKKYYISDDETRTVIDNIGNVESPVFILLAGALGSPIVLTNTTTNESITIRYDLQANESLMIDTSDDNLSVTLRKGSETIDALHYCTVGSQFWKLAVGENVIEYSVGSRGSSPRGYLTFRPRWISR